jgi:hypothetical protein
MGPWLLTGTVGRLELFPASKSLIIRRRSYVKKKLDKIEILTSLLPFFFFNICVCFGALKQDEDALWRVLRIRNEKWKQIKNMACSFKVQISLSEDYDKYAKEVLKARRYLPPPALTEYKWFYKEGKMRLLTKGEKGKDYRVSAIFDGKSYFYYYYPPNDEESLTPSSVVISEESYPIDDNLDSCSFLLYYLGLEMDGKPLSEFLKDYELEIKGKENIDGCLCYVIEAIRKMEVLLENGGKRTIADKRILWIDADTGALHHYYKLTENNEKLLSLEAKELVSYSEYLPLPTRVEVVLYSTKEDFGKNVPLLKREVVIENIDLSSSIPDPLFSPLDLQNGTRVIDERTGRVYISGENLPTDEDILDIANIARDFLSGGKKLEELGQGGKNRKAEVYYCGPNALLAVCGILGVKTSSKEIAKLAGADEKGFTSMAGLKKAAEALGLKAEGVDITIDELRKSKKLAIAFIPPDHYIVVVGFSDDKVVLIDPPTMLGAFPIFSLDTIWDGRALLISKP